MESRQKTKNNILQFSYFLGREKKTNPRWIHPPLPQCVQDDDRAPDVQRYGLTAVMDERSESWLVVV